MLAGFGYDAEGRRTSLAYGNGTSTSYGYDPLGRPASLSHDLLSGGSDVTFGYAYNPAGQIVSRSGAHGLYAWTGHGQGSTATAVDGRNFLTSVGGATASQDARGNLLSDGSASYGYNLKNQLVAKSGTTQLYYEPLGRLTQQWNGGGILDWAGDELVAEVHRSPNRRYVHGDAADDPMIWYEGTSKRYLHADERGSIIAVSDNAGAPLAINRYDEYGRSQTSATGSGLLTGRFGYTGQAWLPEIEVYYYKARMYDPKGGRFLQSDRLGYIDGPNVFAYAGNDPVNRTDPTGLLSPERCSSFGFCLRDDPGTGSLIRGNDSVSSMLSSVSAGHETDGMARRAPPDGAEIVVTASLRGTSSVSTLGEVGGVALQSAEGYVIVTAQRIANTYFDGQYVGDRRVLWKYRDHAAQRVLAYLNKNYVEDRILRQLTAKGASTAPPGTLLRGFFNDDVIAWQWRAMVLPSGDVSVGTVHLTWPSP